MRHPRYVCLTDLLYSPECQLVHVFSVKTVVHGLNARDGRWAGGADEIGGPVECGGLRTTAIGRELWL